MLKPNTQYNHSEADLKFVLELAKVGSVSLLSSQVTLESRGTNGLSFKESNGGPITSCAGLTIPNNWVIEGIYHRENSISVTFGVKKNSSQIPS